MYQLRGKKKLGKIVLVTGGARCGKSRFAEEYAAKVGGKVAYIATANIYDEEMAYRVKLHQERRPKDWATFEAATDAHLTIRQINEAAVYDVILFDCLTLYVSNILCAVDDITDSGNNYRLVREKIDLLTVAAAEFSGTIVFVTNEVGAGIVPNNQLSREYRDLAGITNQIMARVAAEVYLMVCGIGVDIKKLAIGTYEG